MELPDRIFLDWRKALYPTLERSLKPYRRDPLFDVVPSIRTGVQFCLAIV